MKYASLAPQESRKPSRLWVVTPDGQRTDGGPATWIFSEVQSDGHLIEAERRECPPMGLGDLLVRTLKPGQRRFVLDCRSFEDLDSSSLGEAFEAWRAVTGAGGAMAILLPERMRDSLAEIEFFRTHEGLFDSLEDALESVSHPITQSHPDH